MRQQLSRFPKLVSRWVPLAAILAAAAVPSAMAGAPVPPSENLPPVTGTTKVQAQAQSQPAVDDIVLGRYIVKVDGDTDPGSLADEQDVDPKLTFRRAFNGFSAQLSKAELASMKRDPNVVGVEPVTVGEGTATQNYDLPWGLDRIDQRYRPFSGTFTWGYAGYGVNAYIIDSGIQTNHPQFGGRAFAAFDNVGDGWAGQDCHGHGTHVAGTVGGATYGVAKSVRLYSVRTLNCQNKTTSDKEIAAIDWVRANFRRPAVANISIGGPRDTYLNQAVMNLANAGVFVSVSAGNDNVDACNASPASSVGAFTVAASDINDNKASFSNWGACVDAYAPGHNVKSAYPGNRTTLMNGTSMAAPHVAAIIAVAKSAYGDGYTSATWRDWLKANATANVIGGNYAGTPNRLVFKGTL